MSVHETGLPSKKTEKTSFQRNHGHICSLDYKANTSIDRVNVKTLTYLP